MQSAFVCADMTLFIRLLEVSREELKTDEDLHLLAEKCSELSATKKCLTMDDYTEIMSALPPKVKTEAVARLRETKV